MRSLLLFAALLLAFPLPLGAQGRPPVNVNDMVLEVMRTDIGKGRESMAMWLPQEFFVAAGMSQAPGLDPKDLERDLEVLLDYAVFMVQAKIDGEDGSMSLSSSQMRAAATLLDETGRAVTPLAELPPKVEAILNAVRMGFASKGNEDFRLLVFPGRDAQTKRLFVSPTRKGALTLKLAKVGDHPGMSLTWKTPLSSCVKPSTCAKCTEPLQAAWSFCPWCAQPAAR